KINKLYKKNIYKKNTKLNIEKIKNTNELFIKKIIVKFLAKNNIEITEKRVSEILKVIKSDKPNIKLRLDNFYLIKEYNFIKTIEKKLDNTKTNNFIRIEKDGIYNFLNKKIEIKTVLNKNINYKDNMYIKADYPLIIRNKKESDFINAYPNGNKKYLRKIFIDLKIPLYERERVPIITSENDDILALYLEPYGLNRISKNAAVNKDDEYILEINVYYDKE
ncbi:tRNA lysidine(34) synthetase TilS, partial [Brachyspira hyodysenteriae]